MDRKVFFQYLAENQATLFADGISSEQKSGLNTKLDVWAKWYAAKHPVNFLAAALGQIYHETGGKMVPVLEAFAINREQSAQLLEKAYNEGRLSWVKQRYWEKDESGKHPVGGGDIQLTHRRNYVAAQERIGKKFEIDINLAENYDLVLDPVISAHIAFSGMIDGWFRECKLSDFAKDNNTLDYCAARDIVNGDVGLVGKKIEVYCQTFESALAAAGAQQDLKPLDENIDWPDHD
jgi:hypothetical protein